MTCSSLGREFCPTCVMKSTRHGKDKEVYMGVKPNPDRQCPAAGRSPRRGGRPTACLPVQGMIMGGEQRNTVHTPSLNKTHCDRHRIDPSYYRPTGHDGALHRRDGSCSKIRGYRARWRPVLCFPILDWMLLLLSSSRQSWRSSYTSPERRRRRPAPRWPRSR